MTSARMKLERKDIQFLLSACRHSNQSVVYVKTRRDSHSSIIKLDFKCVIHPCIESGCV